MAMKQYGPLILILLLALAGELVLINVELSKRTPLSRAMPRLVVASPTLVTAPRGGDEAPLAPTTTVAVAPAAAISVSPTVKPVKPPAKSLAGPLNLPAQAWLAVYVSPQGERRVLTKHNEREAYPIASLSKLMTAVVAKEEIDPKTSLILNQALEIIEPDAVASSTTWTVAAGDLLFPLLVESNNNAATALAAVSGARQFVREMNKKAKALAMTSTHFVNPHGLDPVDDAEPNEASAADLLRLAEVYVRDYPGLLAITKQEQFALWSLDHEVVRRFTNTNRLLEANNWPADVMGGKTGYTDLADRNLLLVLRDRQSGGYLYTVVLGTNNHFAATSDLLDWVYYNYRF